MDIEHEVITRDGELHEERFWFRKGDFQKILTREQVEAAYKYVRDNPDKFPNISNN